MLKCLLYDDCKDAIKNRKKTERRFGKHPTSDNLCNFGIFLAKARRTLKQNRRISWRNFVGFFEVFGIVSSVFLCTSVRTEASQLCQLDLDAVDGFEDVFVGVFEDVVRNYTRQRPYIICTTRRGNMSRT
jgi:hypothetical protein